MRSKGLKGFVQKHIELIEPLEPIEQFTKLPQSYSSPLPSPLSTASIFLV
jgi:hypothetical protein